MKYFINYNIIKRYCLFTYLMYNLFIVLATIAIATSCCYGSVELTVTEKNIKSIDHTVTIESSNTFKIAFEAAYNYGLSLWHDIINGNNIDLLDNITNYLKSAEQGSVFNQLISDRNGDYGTVGISAKMHYKNNQRNIKIIEKNKLRTIVRTEYYLKEVTDLVRFETTYIIYATGKIIINNTMYSLTDTVIKEWRNSIVGLSDPSFLVLSDRGKNAIAHGNSLRVPDKDWTVNQWAGFLLTQPTYKSWAILGNSSDTLFIDDLSTKKTPLRNGDYSVVSRNEKFGWIRATDRQDPYGWHRERAKYLYLYWDSTTPAPYTKWTHASLMLVPKSDNPYQGIQSTHGWKGFKRFYYQVANIPLKKYESITQHYFMQLGTKGSSLLPDLSKRANVERYANEYLVEHSLSVKNGVQIGSGYNFEKGCYTLGALKGSLVFTMNGKNNNFVKPVFEISGISAASVPVILVDGKVMRPDADYIWHADSAKSMLLVQFLSDINKVSNIEIVMK